ncbi:MAG: hypothetical protein KAQ68_00150 [Clostridiales bacterium]|nr:hypothetical protein [Clostridiales bacterium]
MEDIFSNLVPLLVVISIVFSLVNKAKKAKEKAAKKQGTVNHSKTASPSSLKDFILKQIEEQKASMRAQSAPVTKPKDTKAWVYGEGKTLEGSPTEMQRHAHNAHLGGSYNEGDALNRKTLEGTPTEMQKHAHGGRFNEGDSLNRKTLEGVRVEGMSSYKVFEDNYDKEVFKISKVEKRIRKPKTRTHTGGEYKALKLNRESIVNGIIMSEVLNKRGGRRAD